METAGEKIMCSGCMDVVELVHNASLVPSPLIAKDLVEYIREKYVKQEMEIDDHNIGVLLVVVGGYLMTWDKENG